MVGQAVKITGAGFAPERTFDLADDGVDLGQSTTDANGAFSVSFRPGGLAAGVAQHVGRLDATDGSSAAGTIFTISRSRPVRGFLPRAAIPTR